jgi:type I restriction enzyme S subunit
MNLNNENPKMTPTVRAIGYTDDWVSKTLGSMLVEYNELVTGYKYPVATSSRLGLFLQSDYFEGGRGDVNEDVTFHVVPQNYFTYRHMSDDSIFHFNQNKFDSPVEVSREYPVFSFNDSANSSLIIDHLNSSDKFLYFSKLQKKGGTRTRLYFRVLKKYSLPLPVKQEQDTIATALGLLSLDIKSHIRKLSSLQQAHHWAEQNLLPEPNEATPKVRVGEFDGEWTSTTIGDVSKEGKQRSADGELLSVTQHNGVVRFSETGRKDNSSDDKSNYKWVSEGDLVYNSMRMWQGASGLSKYDGIVSPAYTVVKLEPTVDGNFISLLFKNDPLVFIFRRHSKGLTSDTWNLKYPELSKIGISYPPMEEQQAIAKIFTTVDARIKSEQQLIADLQEVKSWALNNMFV